MTPEEKLASRTWRLRNSAGVLWPIASFGLLSCIPFLFRGTRSKSRLWIIYGIAFAVVTIVLFATTTPTEADTGESTQSAWWGSILLAQWVGSSILAGMTNRKWLLWKAHHAPQAWYAQSPSVTDSLGSQSHSGSGDASAMFQQPSQQFVHQRVQQFAQQSSDINTMQLGDFERLGMEFEAARQILDVRTKIGRYSSFEHLLGSSRVPPHLLLPYRNALTFGQDNTPSATTPKPPGPRTGRTLDL
jgi:hypothetical protein